VSIKAHQKGANMSNIESKTFTVLRDKLRPHLEAVGKEMGIKIETGRGSYATTHGTLKLELSAISDEGKVISKEAEAFKSEAEFYGLKAEDLGREFKTHDQTFIITGLNPRARKMPIQADCKENGRTYKFRVNRVKSLLNGGGQ
jgi:hypothetical protein